MPSPTHPLPDYQWAGTELDEVELPDLTWLEALPPVTASELEQDLPPSPAPLLGDLTPIAHPKIRNLAAYWHEEWPHSRPESLARLDVAERLYVVAYFCPKVCSRLDGSIIFDTCVTFTLWQRKGSRKRMAGTQFAARFSIISQSSISGRQSGPAKVWRERCFQHVFRSSR